MSIYSSSLVVSVSFSSTIMRKVKRFKKVKKMVRKLEKNLILIRHRQWKQVKRGREYATNANNRSVSLNLFLYNNQNPS